MSIAHCLPRGRIYPQQPGSREVAEGGCGMDPAGPISRLVVTVAPLWVTQGDLHRAGGFLASRYVPRKTSGHLHACFSACDTASPSSCS